MKLVEAIDLLTETYNLDYSTLNAEATDWTIGGYHPEPDAQKWPIGSVFGVEGQIIRALAKSIESKIIVNLGVAHGCSLMHLAQTGAKVYAVDHNISLVDQKAFKDYDVEFVESDAIEFIKEWSGRKKIDFLFEDLDHETESVTDVWVEAMPKIRKGGFIVSHDSEHYVVGERVILGLALAGVSDVTRLLIEPSDCGLAVWRNE